MDAAVFEIFRDLLSRTSGLVIGPDKTYLLESRLSPVAKKWEMNTLADIANAIKTTNDNKLVNDVIEAMTTNETSFFRDIKPFEHLKNIVLPELAEKRQSGKSIRIWSAACSSGQEAYSIAMTIKEHPALQGWSADIKGTDISHEIMDQARKGQFSQFEVQRGLPIQLLMKYFSQEGTHWHLKDEIKKMVSFDYLNLLEPAAALGKFDIVFCRNVLIYFNEETKRKVLDMIASHMQDDGYLFLGGAETVLGITDAFIPKPDARGLYIKKT